MFSSYLQLVYTGKFVRIDAAVSNSSENGHQNAEETAVSAIKASEPHLTALAKLYVLADKLEDLTSTNLAMDEFLAVHRKTTKIARAALITWIRAHSSKQPLAQSGARQYLVRNGR